METYRFFFPVAPEKAELLLAWLSDLPFDAFEELEDGIAAFLPGTISPAETEKALEPILGELQITCTWELLPAQNWNAIWESHFSPVQVGNFCGIRANFHPSFKDVKHELLIQPKMAFGTGHHETTHMMIAFMEGLEFRDAAVLDFGCGTGILAILAARLGATDIDAVDIEAPAVENTLENAAVNNVQEAIRVYLGDLDAVPERTYQIILANINRNVILQAFPALYQKLQPGGTLLISGILNTDRELVLQAAHTTGFQLISHSERGNWTAAKLLRP